TRFLVKTLGSWRWELEMSWWITYYLDYREGRKMDKELSEKLGALDDRIRRVERMFQLWLRTNHGTVMGKKPEVDGGTVQLSGEQIQELVDLVYGNTKKRI